MQKLTTKSTADGCEKWQSCFKAASKQSMAAVNRNAITKPAPATVTYEDAARGLPLPQASDKHK